ncbi:hypothetical protein GCM10010321_52880 [Streptomyces chartreusis]|nr:hypothetical protein GCM10010321_52880 [Streptomyces chartreusis]
MSCTASDPVTPTSSAGDCVAGLWGAATALLDLVPSLDGRLGGGIGALALPWDDGG